MKRFIFIIATLSTLFVRPVASAQVPDSTQLMGQEILTLSEYLGYVKSFHPVVKQANLVINEGEAKLLKARGAFDPKLEVDLDNKEFKNTEYYDKLNAAFGAALADPAAAETLLGAGIEPATSTPAELAAFVGAETEKWAGIVKDAGIEPE